MQGVERMDLSLSLVIVKCRQTLCHLHNRLRHSWQHCYISTYLGLRSQEAKANYWSSVLHGGSVWLINCFVLTAIHVPPRKWEGADPKLEELCLGPEIKTAIDRHHHFHHLLVTQTTYSDEQYNLWTCARR